MRFEVIMMVEMSMLVFWVVVACGLVGKCQQCFGEAYCLHFQGSALLVSTYKSTWHYNPEDNIDTSSMFCENEYQLILHKRT
jgi:hypothetical protein